MRFTWSLVLTATAIFGQSTKTAQEERAFLPITTTFAVRAVDSLTGKELWSFKMDGPWNANIMTYQAKNGKQYVAIVAGPTLDVFAMRLLSASGSLPNPSATRGRERLD